MENILKDKKKKETVFALHIEPAELQTDGDIWFK